MVSGSAVSVDGTVVGGGLVAVAGTAVAVGGAVVGAAVGGGFVGVAGSAVGVGGGVDIGVDVQAATRTVARMSKIPLIPISKLLVCVEERLNEASIHRYGSSLLLDDPVLAEPCRYPVRQVWPAGIVNGQSLSQGGVRHKLRNGT